MFGLKRRTPQLSGLRKSWLRGLDLNQRPLGYEPNELPDCSTPHFDTNNEVKVWSNLALILSANPPTICSRCFVLLHLSSSCGSSLAEDFLTRRSCRYF